jgi:hypothetical protein
MKHLLAIVCVTFGCASPDLDLSAAEQAEEQEEWDGAPVDHGGEVIPIEGTWNGCLDAGVCWGELDEHPQDPGDSGWGGGGGGGGDAVVMDPEPDRYRDRKSCEDWCDWSKRQCIKWCTKEHPFPDWYGYNQCLKNRCDNDPDPDVGYKSCRADCQRRFPERWGQAQL